MPRSVIDSTGISGSGTWSRTARIAASSIVATLLTPWRLHPFEGERDSLADADAHGCKRKAAADLMKLVGGGERQARPGHAERVTERDRAAVRIHPRRIVWHAEPAENREPLGGEGLVQLDDVEIADRDAKALHKLFRGGRRADAHDARRHPGDRCAKHA